MDSGLEAAGALATTAAAANALDPDEPKAHAHGAACLNCGAVLSGAYCSNCGQKAHVHRSVLHAVEEFLHGITHFDSKLWNTLPLLAFRPGKLTRDYVQGKRARYVAPVALFLLTVFSMFLLFGFLPGPGLPDGAVEIDPKDRAEALASIGKELTELDGKIAAAEKAVAAAPQDNQAREDLATLKVGRAVAEATRTRLQSGTSETVVSDLATVLSQAGGSGALDMDLGDPGLETKARRALQDPDFLIYKIKQKGYKLSFLLVPLSLPWMILLFAWKRGIRVYDHVVFLLYSISFMSMLAILASLLGTFTSATSDVYVALLVGLPVLHIFAQLKEGYALGWVSAAWRTVALCLSALLTLTAYLLIILLLGLLD